MKKEDTIYMLLRDSVALDVTKKSKQKMLLMFYS